MRIRITILVATLLVWCQGYSQSAFNLVYDNDSSLDLSMSVIQTFDGGYAFVGNSIDNGFTGLRLVVGKLDCTGQIEWKDTLDVNTATTFVSNYPGSILQNTDSSFMVCGSTVDSAGVNYNIFLMKLSALGSVDWVKHYGGAAFEDAHEIKPTPDGNYIIVGSTTSYGAGSYDGYLVKVTPNGNTIWTSTFGGMQEDRLFSVDVTTDGGYILGGHTFSYGLGGPDDMYMVKVDSNGQYQWHKTYGTSGDDFAESLITTLDGGYAFAGAHEISGDMQAYLVKTDALGNTEWDNYYGDTAWNEYFKDIKQLPDSSFIIAADRYVNATQKLDGWLVKLSKSGDSLWSRTWGNTGVNDYLYDVELTSDGGFVLTGQYNRVGGTKQDHWLIKTDSMGCDTCGYDCIACDFIQPNATSYNDTLYIMGFGNMQFYDSSSIVLTRNWDFGNGQTSTEKNPIVTYTLPGTYAVILNATYGTCTDSDTLTLTVIDTLNCNNVSADFLLTDTLWVFDEVTLNLLSTTNTTAWSWNDGASTSSAPNFTATYTAGTYNITLSVAYDTLCYDTAAKQVVIIDTLDCDTVLANFTIVDTLWVFDEAIVNLNGPNNVDAWYWNEASASVQDTSLSYALSGTYNISLSVALDTLCFDTATQQLVVIDTLDCDTVLANFMLQDTLWIANAGSIKLFGPSNADSWLWTIMLGTEALEVSTAQNPTFTIDSAGTYTISLVIELDTLCFDSTAQTITVIDTVTGIQNLEFITHNFKIYPNPSSGSFIIETQIEGGISVYNVSGKVVFKDRAKKGETTCNVNLSAGIYVVGFTPENGQTQFRRLVVY